MVASTEPHSAVELEPIGNDELKPSVAHIETAGNLDGLDDSQIAGKMSAVKGTVDSEVAKYLDSSIVIDDELNKRIKRKVCQNGWTSLTCLQRSISVFCR